MIQIKLQGSVRVYSEHTESGEDGRASYETINSVRQTVEIEAIKTFENGYVNLEGYVLSEHWTTERDMVNSFAIPDNPALDGFTLDRDSADLEIEMVGDKWDWIQQAVKYLTERPDRCLIGVLDKFLHWEETDNETIGEAQSTAAEAKHVTEDVGGLDSGEWNRMLTDLHNQASRDNRALGVQQWKRVADEV